MHPNLRPLVLAPQPILSCFRVCFFFLSSPRLLMLTHSPDVTAQKNLIFIPGTVSVWSKDVSISHEATALHTLLAQCLTGDIFHSRINTGHLLFRS